MKLYVYLLTILSYSILVLVNSKRLDNWLDAPDKSFQYLVISHEKGFHAAANYCVNKKNSTLLSVANAAKLISVVSLGSYRINARLAEKHGYYETADGTQIVGEIPDFSHTDGPGQRTVIMTPGSAQDYRRILRADSVAFICERTRVDPKDCRFASREGEISLTSGPLTKAYCTADGWTVIQSRGQFGNPEDYFNRNWHSMVAGFGVMGKEYWMGLEKMHALTNSDKYALRITATDLSNVVESANWNEFSIGSSSTNYRLTARRYKGGLGGNSLKMHNQQSFTTTDRDNDALGSGNCAPSYDAPWWYAGCFESNLNGLNRNRGISDYKGIIYKDWRGYSVSLRAVRMEVKVLF